MTGPTTCACAWCKAWARTDGAHPLTESAPEVRAAALADARAGLMAGRGGDERLERRVRAGLR